MQYVVAAAMLVIANASCTDGTDDDQTPAVSTAASSDDGGTGESQAGSGDETGTSEGGAPDSSSGGSAVTFDAVSPIYNELCGPCHVTASFGGHNIGSSVPMTGFDDSQLDATSPTCAGLSKGACTLVRIQSGSMPMGLGCTGDPAVDVDNAACLTQAQQDLIQAWLDEGQLGPV